MRLSRLSVCVLVSGVVCLLLCACSELSALEERFPASGLEREYVSSLPKVLRLRVLHGIAAASAGRDYCLFLTSETCAPCRALLAHAEDEGVRDRVDALVGVTGENYRYIRHMYAAHVGLNLEPQPIVPQIVLTRRGRTELYGGYFEGGRTADARCRPHDFARLLRGDQPSLSRVPTRPPAESGSD